MNGQTDRRTTTPSGSWQGRKLARRLWSLTCGQLYQDSDHDPRRTLLVAGTARSGTTWLADILAAQAGARLMFEPFHPYKVSAYERFRYFQYMRPEVDDTALHDFCLRVLSGRIRHRWIDRQVDRLRPQGRIIKEIRANLLLAWLHQRFPEVPLVFLLRHPCAVVLSRLQLGWDTDKDIDAFLVQPELIDDHLQPFLGVIRAATTPEAKHAVIWAVSNLVPLRQFPAGTLPIIHYEDLCVQPEQELRALAARLGTPFVDEAVAALASRPSQTTVRHSAIVQGADVVRQWQRKLSTEQIDRVLDVVAAFGLDHLYGRDPLPRGSSVTRVNATPSSNS